jgi:hypothetical protein
MWLVSTAFGYDVIGHSDLCPPWEGCTIEMSKLYSHRIRFGIVNVFLGSKEANKVLFINMNITELAYV